MMSKNDWMRSIGRLFTAVSALLNPTGDSWTRSGGRKREAGKKHGITPQTWITLDNSRYFTDQYLRTYNPYTDNVRRYVR